jgi:S-adenosylmethionine synthetase
MILLKKPKASLLNGIFHFSSNEKLTKYEICLLIAKTLNKPATHLKPDSKAPQNPVAIRPKDTHLSVKKLETLGLELKLTKLKDWIVCHPSGY